MRPIVLTIAGSDPSGGAGIQADIKSIEANRGYAAAAVTAITVQNTKGVHRTMALDPELVREQIDAVLEDLDVAAVKCGMLADPAVIRAVAGVLSERSVPNVVVDPVLQSHSGQPLTDASSADSLRRELLPLARLVTPNVHEAQCLTGVKVETTDDAARAGRELLGTGCGAVLVTGGHLEGEQCVDVLVEDSGSLLFSADRVDTVHTHGGGCTLSSAIATALAHGQSLHSAVSDGKAFVCEALKHGMPIGHGAGPVDAFHFLSPVKR